MNPESPKNPGEDLELRITALLLGELSEDEASALRQTIAQDAELSRLHDRLKFAIELARETTAAPAEEEMTRPDALKLAPERRAKLLAAFAAPKIVKLAAARRAHRRELLALAAMLAVLLAVASVLLPSLAKSKARAQRTTPLGGRGDLAKFHDEESVALTRAGEGVQDIDAADRPVQMTPPPARYYARDTPAVRRQVSEGLATTPANRPSASTAAASLSPAEAAVSESVRRSVGAKDAESGKLAAYGGRIALPEAEVPRGEDDISRRSNVSDFFSDSKLSFLDQFTWAAPSGGAGSGGGGAGEASQPNGRGTFELPELRDDRGRLVNMSAGGALVGPSPGLPVQGLGTHIAGGQLGDTTRPEDKEWTRARVAVGGKDTVEGKPADVLGATINLYSELSTPPVDPATGLPAQRPETRSVTVTGGGSGVALGAQITNPAWIGVPDRGVTSKELALSYGTVTNSAFDFSTFATVTDRAAPDEFQKNLRGIITQGASETLGFDLNGAQKKDFDADGSRGWFDASGQAAAANRKMPAGAPVIIDGLADHPTAKPGEMVALEGRPISGPAESVNREIESLRQVRDQVALRIAQEKVDAAIPRTSNVEIIDLAEADSTKRESFWRRLGGAFSGGVEKSARIAVPKETPVDDGFTIQRPAGGYDPYWMQNEMEQIESKAVLSKVVEKLNLNQAWAEKQGAGNKAKAEDTVELLKQMTTVSKDPKSGLIDIRVKGEKAEEAARIANTIAEVYRDQRLEEKQRAAIRGVETLQKELVDQEKKIAEVEQRLALRSDSYSVEPPDAGASRPVTPPPVPQPEIFAAENSFSTFSLNVSDVSFKLAAASLEKGVLPEPATVRTEEFINAFDYRDPEPTGSAPIAFAWERARYPFAHDRDLVRFSVKTAASGRQPGRPLNLVLLLDNSGSMERSDRLRIRQECLRVLASQLQTNDRVSVVAFARTAQLWVDGLPGNQSDELPQRVGGLTPQGGTNLEEAMNLAYQTALRHFLPEGVNRVVLLTDGAANLGDVEPESLKKKVEANRRQGIALDCFGIGWEGYNDDLLEVLSRNGDGRYGFVNTTEAASTEFAGQLAGALKVAASDVKVQVEFNPRRVTAYRQLGYAKHQLKKEQFRDNTVDAAEIGAAEAGNALYVVQVNPRGEGPLGTVRVRFKVPGTGDYREHEWPVPYDGAAKPLEQSPFPMRLATTAAAFSEWLVSSPYAAEVAPDRLLTYLSGVPESCPADPRPKKLEWIIRQAKSVAGK
jgi:Mg-chelatase subunit ChlD